MERELGKLEGIIEYRQSLSVKSSEMEENLIPVPRQEVLEIMKAVQESAILGAGNSDIAEARKIFEKIALSAKEFIIKISGVSKEGIVEESNFGELKKKQAEIQTLISAIEKKEKEITENISRFKLEIEENRRKVADLEKENYQAEHQIKRIKRPLGAIKSGRRQGKTKDR